MDILDLFRNMDCNQVCSWREVTAQWIKCQNPYCRKSFKIIELGVN